MEFITHDQSLDWKLRISTVKFPDADDLPPSKSQIRLHLKTVVDHHHFVVPDEDRPTEEFVDVARGEWAQSTVDVDRLSILKPATGKLDRILRLEFQRSHEYLFESLQRELKRFLLVLTDQLRNYIERSTKLRGIRAVKIVVMFKVEHLCYERLLVQGVLQRSFDENDGMRPASKSARTQMLTRMSFDNKMEETCMVCLEELTAEAEDDQCEILSMPCSHRFHGPCIHKWLDTSHFCPICRFEMPIDQMDES